jgi:hypothetical protein
MMSSPEAWFRDAITSGLQALVVLHLPGGPGHDTVAYTRDVWVRTLWGAPIQWDVNVDRRRIDAAFNRLARQVDRWPAPRALLERLPPRPKPRALPAPKLTEAERRRNSERLHAGLREAMRNG